MARNPIGRPHFRGFTISHSYTTLCRTPVDEWSAQSRDLYLTTHNNHKKQPSMNLEGFKPANPTRKQTRPTP